MAELVGSVFGTAAFNAIIYAMTRRWPLTADKILIVSALMFAVLTVGDYTVRDRPLSDTLFRMIVSQGIVTLFMLAVFWRKASNRT